MAENKERCLIIDGNNLVYRCYYVSQKLTIEKEIGTVFIFLRIIISLLKENNYQKLFIAFDSGKKNFRHALFSNYKINRLATPQEFIQKIIIIQELLEKTGIAFAKLNNFEADDLIASFINQNKQNYPIINFDILSQDKDLLQLLSPQVSICKYLDKQVTTFHYSDFLQEYNFLPVNYLDYLSLLGDTSDNIIGVEGIGEKKAKQLIQQFNSVENIYANLDKLPDNWQKLLLNKQALVYQNKQLISLKKDLLLPINWENCTFDWEKWRTNENLREFCQANEFKSILKALDENKHP